jgi:hypothetical protein
MKITLENSEVQEAMADYVAKHIIMAAGMRAVVTLRNDAKAEGYTAEVRLVKITDDPVAEGIRTAGQLGTRLGTTPMPPAKTKPAPKSETKQEPILTKEEEARQAAQLIAEETGAIPFAATPAPDREVLRTKLLEEQKTLLANQKAAQPTADSPPVSPSPSGSLFGKTPSQSGSEPAKPVLSSPLFGNLASALGTTNGDDTDGGPAPEEPAAEAAPEVVEVPKPAAGSLFKLPS